MTDTLELDFADSPASPPAGNRNRFTGRWHLVGAGLANVWRYGNLELPATSGRLLLRGPNGTGKTTALEALWPFLLDLDHGQGKLSAGKARTTTLKQLMAEGAKQKGRRYGYVWLTVAPPIGIDEPAHVSYGVRLQYSPSSSPAVTVIPFTVPARPVRDFALETETGSALENDDFTRLIESHHGQVFPDPDSYVEDLSARVFAATPKELRDLASRLRQVRNPALLADLSADRASDALREALPNVDPVVIAETADALAASETTRTAFERDRMAADVLAEFARVWAGHVAEVAKDKLTNAQDAGAKVARLRRAEATAERAAERAAKQAELSRIAVDALEQQHTSAVNTVRAIERSEAYKAAGTIRDLTARLTAERGAARSSATTLATKAAAADRQAQDAVSALEGVLEQLGAVLRRAQDAGQSVPEIATLLAHNIRLRQVRSASDVVASPGAGVSITHNAAAWSELDGDLENAAATHATRANTAQLLITAHGCVADAERLRDTAEAELERAETTYGAEQQVLAQAVHAASTAARELVDLVAGWTGQHPDLCAIDPLEPGLGEHWIVEDVTALMADDPAGVLASVGEWAQLAVHAAERIAAGHEATARQHDQNAAGLADQAAQLRARAGELRTGKLLEFPRPEWAGISDDETALGSVLEWVDGLDSGVRDRLEVALAASGLLTAQLASYPDGVAARTAVWSVSSHGPVATSNLTTMLTVDGEHPSAAAALSVLERIELTDTATTASGTGLVVGRDGTFAAGPLAADPVAAATADGQPIPEAGFVGARTRRDRARAKAELLERQAATLDQQAIDEQGFARDVRASAGTARENGRSFPAAQELHIAEAARSSAAQRTSIAKDARDTVEAEALAARAEHRQLKEEWVASTALVALPADVSELAGMVEQSRAREQEISAARDQLARLAAGPLERALKQLPDEDALAQELARMESEAQQAHSTAEATQTLLDEVGRDSGAEDAVTRHRDMEEEAKRLAGELAPARAKAGAEHDAAVHAEAAVEPARQAVTDALPAQTATVAALHTLLTWTPAAVALDVTAFLTAAGAEPTQGLGEGEVLLENAATLLAGKQTFARKTLTDRYDTAKAELTQTWTIAFGVAPAGVDVDTFDLTHDEHTYDPAGAAVKGGELARRAKEALDDAEADALQRFVVGKLPNSIGHAWQQLQDWTREVNAKMRSAQASSGVGVRVRINPRDDLDTAAHTVFGLACKLGEAARTDEQRQQVGKAIERRLAGAIGDTMAERLADAVDITSWIDVEYMVTRADDPEKERKWGRNTGLSGGERRLVVLAPMLAAIAAGYDKFGPAALRLLPLDEVPAEVDEQGREGLARYIGQLDLDLVATSYLWDGAPGAWDGIDAHDLEAGSDGTVVAFPMLVRGLLELPGDAKYISPAGQGQ